MQQILEFLDTKYIDWTIFLLVIASGFFQSRFLSPFVWYKKDSKYDATLKTFVVSLVLSAIYTWLWKYEAGGASATEQVQGIPWLKIFISFGLATSFYDIILKLFKLEFKKKTGIDADNPDK